MSEIVSFHGQLVSQAAAYLKARVTNYATEYALPNGRVADLIGVNRAGEVYIIEAKTFYTSFLLEQTWTKYHAYCNYLYIATPLNTEDKHTIATSFNSFPPAWQASGHIMLCRGVTSIIRAARHRSIAPVSRAMIASNLQQPSAPRRKSSTTRQAS